MNAAIVSLELALAAVEKAAKGRALEVERLFKLIDDLLATNLKATEAADEIRAALETIVNRDQ